MGTLRFYGFFPVCGGHVCGDFENLCFFPVCGDFEILRFFPCVCGDFEILRFFPSVCVWGGMGVWGLSDFKRFFSLCAAPVCGDFEILRFFPVCGALCWGL